MKNNESWLDSTGQRWKLITAFVLLIVALLVYVFDDAILTSNGWSAHLRVLPGAIALGWIALSFRCELCGHKVGYLLARRAPITKFYRELTTSHVCPGCGEASSSSAD